MFVKCESCEELVVERRGAEGFQCFIRLQAAIYIYAYMHMQREGESLSLGLVNAASGKEPQRGTEILM